MRKQTYYIIIFIISFIAGFVGYGLISPVWSVHVAEFEIVEEKK